MEKPKNAVVSLFYVIIEPETFWFEYQLYRLSTFYWLSIGTENFGEGEKQFSLHQF